MPTSTKSCHSPLRASTTSPLVPPMVSSLKFDRNAGSVTIRADPATLKISESWLDADVRGVAEVLSDIKRQLPPLPDGHLLLIAPYRDEPHLLTGSDARGSG